MKTERSFPKFIITKKGERWLETGHPWIYSEEVICPEELNETELENGSVVDAVSENGKYLGSGFYSRYSKIRIRLISGNANDTFDEKFWARRVSYAIDYRMTVMGENTDAFRVIFGEADGFPGLTVDKFHDILVAQVLSVGAEKIKGMLFKIIADELKKRGFPVSGLFERNDVAIRKLEGLEQYKGWFDLPGCTPPASAVTEIEENGIRYEVDVENGQKTGFFLDQKFNRLAVAGLAKGKRVLDCFTHTGSFALNAAMGGAEHVTAVDVSASAIEMAKKNAARNGLSEKMDFLVADVFNLLPELIENGGHPYDFIILDPPAFTKSRKTAGNAERGYKEINYRALKLLPRGGYLATASCSHFMPHEQFEKMLRSAAKDACVELKQIEMRQQAPDHPILWNVPETDYLKFYLFQVI
ncbi:MAG: class I SAM-dependent rRNA methyltransferase [Eubacteriales bacterium]|nr:class I SAM-dependent rRNA methyltransferase [Eubacteriales bacterium]